MGSTSDVDRSITTFHERNTYYRPQGFTLDERLNFGIDLAVSRLEVCQKHTVQRISGASTFSPHGLGPSSGAITIEEIMLLVSQLDPEKEQEFYHRLQELITKEQGIQIYYPSLLKYLTVAHCRNAYEQVAYR